ncbi:F0F1 ATP synthase subunit delta [Nanchangia anserum]|uniref:ATP synthase subunit delta n=1 Tax=Nanchangia anserum TaxID=2692125 RepID=A0A8I0GD33_9ACTO|nr:F0F1 ATP synthase subunit delta [Nanchangia anserum]MBD3689935.1 F0F1 ATP synthase subunit delta [Nanchangia anserum]QOX82251.1 F0F1 ATP synthase subunit delta [Nanchangia anserum]
MRASSEAAREAGRDRLIALIAEDGETAQTLSGELFALADLLNDQPKVAAALTDPTRAGEDRARLAERLLTSVTPACRDIVATMARQRWSHIDDLAHAADDLGAQALAIHARSRGVSEQLRNDLFDAEEVIANHRDLRITLSERGQLSAGDRVGIIHRIFDGKVSQDAVTLLERAVRAEGAGHIASTLRRYRDDVAAIEGVTIATVHAATTPTEEQVERLRRALSTKMGCDVVLNVAQDPELVGGMRVSVGSTIYDGTIRSALDEAERRLAGKARA